VALMIFAPRLFSFLRPGADSRTGTMMRQANFRDVVDFVDLFNPPHYQLKLQAGSILYTVFYLCVMVCWGLFPFINFSAMAGAQHDNIIAFDIEYHAIITYAKAIGAE
jgi:hypothetical protein